MNPDSGFADEKELNRRWLANVQPMDWKNPEPAPRYNLVVVGAGTAGLVAALMCVPSLGLGLNDRPIAVDAAYPERRIGISEYGAGANIAQHAEEPIAKPAPDGKLHPEEYQNLFHEAHWQAMKARPFLWCKFVWNLCDFASDARNEGGTPGRNDKGLVTYDRRARKDAFYWYKANWTTNPMVYITGHTFTKRLKNAFTAKVYANCDSVELFVNGVSQGARASTNQIFTWPVNLSRGTNEVLAVGAAGGVRVKDSLLWITPPAAVMTATTPSEASAARLAGAGVAPPPPAAPGDAPPKTAN